MTDFEKAVKKSAEKAVLKIISDGGWLEPDYRNRFKLPASFLSDVWQLVDVDNVKKELVKKLENELADRIVNSIASEISTDIKQILSVKERREAIRAVTRENLDRICKS